ncbi:hypothetical protein [Achromobacter sp. ESBL13]|uniref:hypothetical protein n=1 Tax=Achromobacter sp. ESBL13 TaxID=3077328 RepID=UPI002FCBBAAA
MATYALIQDGVVTELYETEKDIYEIFHSSLVWLDTTKVIPAPVVGWTYNGKKFSPPDAEPLTHVVPSEVSAGQAYAALAVAGLLDVVTDWAAAPDTDPIHRIAFEKGTSFRRDSPAVEAARIALGLSDTQLDELFAAASGIRL